MLSKANSEPSPVNQPRFPGEFLISSICTSSCAVFLQAYSWITPEEGGGGGPVYSEYLNLN